jgi:isopenicillin N synthase-like dioxygenase
VPGGLQVRTKGGAWVDVDAPAESLVINIGDLMMRWTNDVWLSNLHRVVNPPRDVAGSARRQSLAFFFNPKSDVVIENITTCVSAAGPRNDPPVTVGEYLSEKIRQSVPAA